MCSYFTFMSEPFRTTESETAAFAPNMPKPTVNENFGTITLLVSICLSITSQGMAHHNDFKACNVLCKITPTALNC